MTHGARRPVAAALASLLLVVAGAASAQGISLAGRMGERALLVIDGRTAMLAVGQQSSGVRLLRWDGDIAVVERGGIVQTLQLGSAPVRLAGPGTTDAAAGTAAAATASRSIVIPAGPGGHFVAAGSINGRSATFMVDTGATRVAISRQDAERLGLDLRGAAPTMVQTANGPVAAQMLTLTRLRIGELEVGNVEAIVVPMAMPYVLLGNSWLDRFQMRRDNDVMRLDLR